MATTAAPRLGLALSGGGFRASFFHIGVFHRLAELDLLRHVSTISTVSGGSIVGAHYYLLLKRALETKQTLSKQDYLDIVTTLQRQFAAGNAWDLRNYLLMNPATHLNALLAGEAYGSRMAKLYTRAFFRNVTSELYPAEADYARDGIPLRRARVNLGTHPQAPGSVNVGLPNAGPQRAMNLAEFNNVANAWERIPRMIFNATSLNTGGPFHFMLGEVGGPLTGFVRFDEVFLLLQYKLVIEGTPDGPLDDAAYERLTTAAIAEGRAMPAQWPHLPPTHVESFPDATFDALNWWLAAWTTLESSRTADAVRENWRETAWADWKPRSEFLRGLLDEETGFRALQLERSDFGLMRRAKVAAWYLLDDRGWQNGPTRDGFSRDDYERKFWMAIREIDAELHDRWHERATTNGRTNRELLQFIICVYYLRTADVIDWRAPYQISDLTLSDAVAASANFPPVFTPFKLDYLFDRRKFKSLSLTDGGVHDNQGVEALLEEGCTHIIASDAGGLLQTQAAPPQNRVFMMTRVIDLLMGGLRAAQLSSVQDQISAIETIRKALESMKPEEAAATVLKGYGRVRPLRALAFFHMTSNPTQGSTDGLGSYEADAVARIRTDLDGFNLLEREALVFQGYQIADRYLRKFMKSFGPDFALPDKHAAPSSWPAEPWLVGPRSRQLHLLDASCALVGRVTAAYPRQALAVTATVAAAAFAFDFGRWEQLRGWWDHRAFDAQQATIAQVSWLSATAAMLSDSKEDIGVMARNVSLPGVLLLLAIILGAAGRWRSKREEQSLSSHLFWSHVRGIAAEIFRMPNVISGLALLTFLVTWRVKWLVFVLPLWCIPLSLVFAAFHFIAWPIWQRAR